MKAYLSAWYRAFDFKGRSSRQEFWLFLVANTMVSTIMLQIDYTFKLNFTPEIPGPFYYTYMCLALFPTIAFLTRRMHDIGRPGYQLFYGLIPIVGPILLYVFLFSKEKEAGDKYGVVNEKWQEASPAKAIIFLFVLSAGINIFLRNYHFVVYGPDSMGVSIGNALDNAYLNFYSFTNSIVLWVSFIFCFEKIWKRIITAIGVLLFITVGVVQASVLLKHRIKLEEQQKDRPTYYLNDNYDE